MKIQLFALLLLLAANSIASALPPALQQIVDQALENSPEFAVEKLQHELSMLQLSINRRELLPGLSLSARTGTNRSSEYIQYSYSQSLSDSLSLQGSFQDYFTGTDSQGTLKLTSDLNTLFSDQLRKTYDLEREKRILSYKKTTESFKLEVIRSTYELVRQQNILTVRKESLEHWKNTFEYYQARFKIGAISKITMLNAEINFLEQENLFNQQTKSLSNTIESYKILIGFPLESTLEINSEISGEHFDWTDIPLQKSFDVQIREHELELIRIENRKKHLHRYGDFTFTSEYNRSSGEGAYSGTLGYTVDLGRNHPGLSDQATDLQLSIARRSLERAGLESHRQRLAYIAEYDYLKRNLDLSEKKLKSATESYEYAQLAIQKGMISSLDLQDAQQKLTNAQQDRLNANINFLLLKYEMIYAFGGEI
ncbi:MAG: TolC family protein [Candidatus Wallbacteria bacterium]|nr:TolC family protein [Candidatus Wallbacteria bacterium]